jgi:hypothetical protein
MTRIIRFAAPLFLFAALGGQAATLSGNVRATAAAGATGTPIEGAKVVLIKVALGGGGAGGGAQTRIDSVNTDAQGAYSFDKVDTGTALINASKEGYANGTGFTAVAADTGHYTVNITLRPPADTTPGMLTGTVRAGSAQGTPIAGATVIVARNGGGGGAAVADTLEADAQGHFGIASLAPATYSVRASATGYLNGTANATVRARDTTEVNVVLLPENASGSISGKVAKAAGGSAVSGAHVILSRTGGGGGAGTFTPDTAETGADGAYKFDSVPVQQGYVLTVKTDSYQTAVTTGISVAFEQNREADFFLVPVVMDDTSHGSVAGQVTDSAHKALEGVRVILSRTAGAGGGAATADTIETDADGRFLFASVTAQTGYRLSLSLTGYQGASAFNLNVTVGQTVVSNLVMQKASGIRAVGAGERMRLLAGRDGRLTLEMPAGPSPARVRVYDLAGAVRFQGSIAAGATRLEIPWVKGRAGYVMIERGGDLLRMPAAPSR